MRSSDAQVSLEQSTVLLCQSPVIGDSRVIQIFVSAIDNQLERTNATRTKDNASIMTGGDSVNSVVVEARKVGTRHRHCAVLTIAPDVGSDKVLLL